MNRYANEVDWLKRAVKKTPVVREVARALMRWTTARADVSNFNSAEYWESRYRAGRSSGPGSYNRLAEFKAQTLNRFVDENDIKSVIEFGCGDGSQLQLANYPSYVGVDVSRTVIDAAKRKFEQDRSKHFLMLDEVTTAHRSDLSISLDVAYHLIEDDVFERHMHQLLDAAGRYAIVYSSNEERLPDSTHVRHRKFTDWIKRNRPDFRQVGFVKNPYPEDPRDIDNTSFADFYFFAKVPAVVQA